jgi:Cyclin
LIQRNNFLLTELNVHRVVITSILLAAKFFDDAYYNNAYYAKVGGVLVSEINGLEVDFLFRINFSLHVTPDEFEKYRCELLSHSVTVSAIPTLEVHHAPAQVSPEVHSAHSAPAVMDAEPFMNCCPSELMNATTVALQITTSSPSAAQIVEAFVNAVVPDTFYPHEYVFPPVHRAHSMPVIPKASSPLYQQQQRVQPATDPMYPRCAQPIGAMPQFPTPDNPYGIIMDSRQIYPAQPTLVHHHHGSFPHRPNVVDGSVYGVAPRDVVGPQTLAPMLTSMTGGGL